MLWDGVGWINLARQMTDCCEHGNESSGSIKVGNLLAIGRATGFIRKDSMGLVIRVDVRDTQYGAMKSPDAFLGQGTRVTAPASKADCVSVRQWVPPWLVRTQSSL